MQKKKNQYYELSVVLPTYNRKDILEKTLYALEDQSLDQEFYEVIVINDGSTDGTEEVLERFKNRTKLHFTYASKKNEGQGIARNAGVELAYGKVVLFLQDDIIPAFTCLEEHLKVHRKFFTENFICLGFTTWHPDLKVNAIMKFLEDIGMQFKYEELEECKLIDPVLDLRQATIKHFYTSNISIKRKVLLREKFDARLKKYGWEDIELGYRLVTNEDAIILYNAQAKGYHYHPMDEESMMKRAKQIGKSAVKVRKINKRLPVLPGPMKKLIFRLLSLPPCIWILRQLSKGSDEEVLTPLKKLYYYAVMKREFLKGIAQGKKLAKKK